MLRLLVLSFCCLAINAQVLEEAHPAPEPYSFAYSAPNEDGSSSSREETGDANGRITGFYTLLGEGGQQRRVEYVADENGFRASVQTNEIGTESKNAADAEYLSSAPTAAELVAQWEASGAGKAQRAQRVGAGLNVGLIAPAQRRIIAAQAGLNAGGLGVGVGPVGVAPIGIGPIGGGIARVQALRAQTAGPIGVSIAGPIRGGLIGSQGLRAGGLVGGGLVGVAPIGGVQQIQTLRTQTLGGLNGIGIAGLAPAGGLQTIGLGGLGGLGGLAGLQGNAIGGGNIRLVSGGLQGVQGLHGLQGLQGLGLQGIGLQGLGLQGLVRNAQGRVLIPQALSSELIGNKS